MDRRQTIQKFYKSFEARNSDELLKFFAPKGLVHTPVRKTEQASSYYPQLLSKTKNLKIETKEIFQSIDNKDHLAVTFSFKWELPEGIANVKEAISIFEFEQNSDKIKTVTAIYDTAEFKKALTSAIPA